MPTSIPSRRHKNATPFDDVKRQEDSLDNWILVCVWASLELFLAALLFRYGFDPAFAQALIIPG
jgi:hypothetical protein